VIQETVYSNINIITNLILADSLTLCINESNYQLEAEIANGAWSGPGVSETGEFDPIAAGVGLHEIQFETYEEGCGNFDTIIIEVNDIISGEMDQSVVGKLTAPEADKYRWLRNGNFLADTTRTINVDKTAEYSVMVTNANGCTSTIEAGQVLGSSKNLSDNLYTIHPNPANDHININLNSELSGVKAQLYSLEGRLIWEKPLINNSTRIEVDNIFSGSYILKLISNEGIATKKILIK
jgi:hypothetical protein